MNQFLRINTGVFQFRAALLLALLGVLMSCKDEDTGPKNTVSDIDGNVYDTVSIGTQVWMKSNLKVSRYRNGEAIPTGLDTAEWQLTDSGAYAIYKDEASKNNTYGKLYNWYAVADPRGLCPVGWRVPSKHDWNKLTVFLDPAADTICGLCDSSSEASKAMRAVSPLWASGFNANNSSGFTGLPGGTRDAYGTYINVNTMGYWWSVTESSLNSAWFRSLSYDDTDSVTVNIAKTTGFSVRCIR